MAEFIEAVLIDVSGREMSDRVPLATDVLIELECYHPGIAVSVGFVRDDGIVVSSAIQLKPERYAVGESFCFRMTKIATTN